jgi:hypothetical protein
MSCTIRTKTPRNHAPAIAAQAASRECAGWFGASPQSQGAISNVEVLCNSRLLSPITAFKPEQERRIKMSKFGKYLLLVTGFAILATFARIPGAVINVRANNGGCSVASLKGTYGFNRTGVNNVVGGPIASIGTQVYNGDGTFGLTRLTRSDNGDIQDWTYAPPSVDASYTVDADCTGSLFTADGTKTNNLVVLDGGKRFFLLSAATGTIVTEEGIRLDEKDKD